MRGLIYTDDVQSIEGNRIRVQAGLTPTRLKSSLLFWDEIYYIWTPRPIMPYNISEGFIKELQILQKEKVLKHCTPLTKAEWNTARHTGVALPSFINHTDVFWIQCESTRIEGEIEGVGLFMQGDTMEIGNGVRMGLEQMRAKEIYTNILLAQAALAKGLNARKEAFWSIGQTGHDFEMPPIQGVSKERQLYELNFQNIVPFPSPDTPIEEILTFKEKRRAELTALQLALSKLNSKIETSQGAPRVIQDCKDEITVALTALHRTLDESKIQKVSGVVKTLLDVKPLNAAPVIAGLVAHLANVDVSIGALAGYAISGAISLLCKKENKIDKLDGRVKDFAYLYYVDKQFKH